ncbi:hypothetical protein LTR27_009639 [Elasticomyces elasticus]|nr:hypothetical protein LTR27_009639 [Elasticomyces elasticus]
MNLVDDEKAQRAEHIEHVELVNEANVGPDAADYHILPKRTLVEDLPFIASTEVAKRNGKEGRRLWIVVDNTVLDVTDYQQKHPGGRQIIAGFGGQNCSWQWWSFHGSRIWQSTASGLRIGRTSGISNPYQRPAGIVGLRKHGFQDWD